MTKAEFVKALANKAELSNKDAMKAVDAFIELVTETLSDGGEVVLTGFGFSVSERKTRTVRDFCTGRTVDVLACKVAKFKAGKLLVKAVE